MLEKTNPIQTHYLIEDCRSPSGLAMTDYKTFAQNTKLKKQSQFVPSRINVKSYAKGEYVKFRPAGHKKNKANSKFILSPFGYAQGRLRLMEPIWNEGK